ncbi:hypothetical protein M3Y94_00074500 [Aphelenchoides besseyi]|nr:hypothetical protein M3Y94_00074500 [Aphelenchoides besseyi]
MPDSASSPLVDALYRCPGPSFKPIVLVDCEGIEEKTISLSFANTEQEVIAMRLYRVIKTLNPNSSVLIVSTYSAAKIRLQQNGVPTADVVTVDQSQGKEADVVIVVSVITKHASSFFTKKQRLNVMTSRAKTSMFIVGKMKWLSTQKNWTKLISLWKDPKVGNAIEINAKRLLVVEDWMSGAFNQIYEFPPKEIDAAGVGEEVEYDPEQPFHSLRSYFLHLDDPDSGTTSEASEDESESEDSSDEDDSQEKHQRTSAHLESTSSRFGKRKHENEPVQIEYVSSAKSSKQSE